MCGVYGVYCSKISWEPIASTIFIAENTFTLYEHRGPIPLCKWSSRNHMREVVDVFLLICFAGKLLVIIR